jgi:hypothetical protein
MATQPIETQPVPDAVIAAGAEEAQMPANDERDYESEARVMGWKPEEEFAAGEKRPREFRDAKTFVEVSEEKAGLQKQTIAHLKEEVSFLKRQFRKLAQSEQNSYANALNDIRSEMEEAVAAGDVNGFKLLDQKAEKIRKDMQDDGVTQSEDPADQVLAFRENNPWYDKASLASATEAEVEARLFADRTADKWIAQGLPATMKPSEFYAKLADEVNGRFPMLKHRPVRAKPPSDVAGVTRTIPARSNVSLTADEKAQAERYMRQKIPGFRDCKSADEAHKLFAKLGAQ